MARSTWARTPVVSGRANSPRPSQPSGTVFCVSDLPGNAGVRSAAKVILVDHDDWCCCSGVVILHDRRLEHGGFPRVVDSMKARRSRRGLAGRSMRKQVSCSVNLDLSSITGRPSSASTVRRSQVTRTTSWSESNTWRSAPMVGPTSNETSSKSTVGGRSLSWRGPATLCTQRIFLISFGSSPSRPGTTTALDKPRPVGAAPGRLAGASDPGQRCWLLRASDCLVEDPGKGCRLFDWYVVTAVRDDLEHRSLRSADHVFAHVAPWCMVITASDNREGLRPFINYVSKVSTAVEQRNPRSEKIRRDCQRLGLRLCDDGSGCGWREQRLPYPIPNSFDPIVGQEVQGPVSIVRLGSMASLRADQHDVLDSIWGDRSHFKSTRSADRVPDHD